MAAVEVVDLSMVFGNNFRALDKVSIKAEQGEFITLLGPSGCGKTTLLRLIAGFYSPESGKVLIADEDVTQRPPEHRDTAMVFQSYALFPHMTVAGNIEFGLKQQKLDRDKRVERIHASLAAVSMESQRDKRPAALSGGQQQRVALARALAMRPGIVLFDEPLSNLDAKLREQVRFELRELQQESGFTAIYVTHDQSEALAMSDRIYLMNEGKIEQSGSPEHIYQHPVNRFVADFLGVANIFSADVVESTGDRHIAVTPFGRLTVHADTPPPKHVYMSWRPEDARLVDHAAPTTENEFELQVATSVFLGNLTDVFGHVPADADTSYRIQFLGSRRFETGSVIRLSIDPSKIQVLEAIE